MPRTFAQRTFHQGITGSPPTLAALADNANGTGAVATIGGSTSGTNTLYVQQVLSGGVTSSGFSAAGTRSGDGTVPLSLTPGQYWAYASNSGGYSNLRYFSVTDSDTVPASVMLHSPAFILSKLLITAGQLNAPPSLTWPVYVGNEPSTPDAVVTIYDTQGRGDGRSMLNGEQWFHQGIQLRFRAADYKTAFARSERIGRYLDQDICNTWVAVEDNVYQIDAINQRGNGIDIGNDSPASKRRVITMNATLTLRRIS